MNAELTLADDRDGVGAEVVVVHPHASKHGVLDGHHGPVHRLLLHGLEHILKRGAGMEICVLERAPDRLFAKGTRLSLKRNALGHACGDGTRTWKKRAIEKRPALPRFWSPCVPPRTNKKAQPVPTGAGTDWASGECLHARPRAGRQRVCRRTAVLLDFNLTTNVPKTEESTRRQIEIQ